MWPFKRKEKAAEPTSAGQIVGGPICVSQVDITERFGDDERLGSDDWIPTLPMNTIVENPESMGLPPLGADANEVYRVASQLSSLREAIPIPTDGVYCPVCHIANVDIGKLRHPVRDARENCLSSDGIERMGTAMRILDQAVTEQYVLVLDTCQPAIDDDQKVVLDQLSEHLAGAYIKYCAS